MPQAQTPTKAEVIAWLQEVQKKLQAAGEQRYPKRSDFSSEQVNAIKAQLGPWGRALEAAGLKLHRDAAVLERRAEKRIRAKRRRTAAKQLRMQALKSNSSKGENT